ncbi:MAG: FG-GAP repeat protein [Planctomycetes bacterium]|nr:FG-GAP repeat protein [Planctomycetota bacterium]
MSVARRRLRLRVVVALPACLLLSALLDAAPYQERHRSDSPPALAWRAASGEGRELDAREGLHALVTAEGLTCTALSRTLVSEPRTVTVRVRTTAFGRLGAPIGVGRGVVSGSASRVELLHDGLLEWFEAHESGVEHGWTIVTPPRGASDEHVWIGLAFEGLAPKVEESGLGAHLVDERGQDRLYYRGLRAFDASGRALPARMRPGPSGVGIEVDDRGAAYPITVDPVLSTLYWSYDPNLSPSDFGVSAWSAGDVNADGFSDFVVGMPYYSVSQPNGGAVFVWFGPTSGASSPPDQVLEMSTPMSAAAFGISVAGLGDLDGDGFEDVVVGASGYHAPEASEGALFFLRGSATGLQVPSGPFFETDVAGAELGRSVAAAGDVNGDGFTDLLAGTGAYTAGGIGNRGKAYLFLGSAAGPTGHAWSELGDRVDAQYGEKLAGVGDVDGDGFDDWVVSALGFANPEALEGAAWLYRGSASGIGSTVGTLIREGNEGSALFGSSVAGAGDVDGDGFADVLVGASSGDGGRGRVYLFYGSPSGLQTTPWIQIGEVGTTEAFGGVVNTAGDVDGDGFADIVVSALGFSGPSSQGRAFLFRGSPDGPIVPSAAELLSGGSDPLFGYSISSAGDVNGDGRTDLIVGHPYFQNSHTHEGRAYLYLGQPTDTPLVAPSLGQTASLAGPASSSFATALTTEGDVNADGYSDLLVGSPDFDATPNGNEGRVQLFLGGADGLASTAQWTYTGTIAGGRLGAALAFAGDVNDDGWADVLLGAPRASLGQLQEGVAYLFHGNATGALANTPSWSFESNQTGAFLGESVAGAGDVDGDGYTDVFLGAPGIAHAGFQNSGSVLVFRGSASGLALAPVATIDNPLPGAFRFGAAVANAGDLNRDGRTELLVGAPDTSAPEFREGRAYVYLGSGVAIAATPAFTVESDVPNALLGAAVSAAGDVDADGFADLLVGVPDLPGGGQVRLYRGQAGVNPVAPGAQTFASPQSGSRFGVALARAGDVNADGFSDVALAAPNWNVNQGKVQLFLGTSSGLASTPALEFDGASGAQLGAGLGPCGDVDGDGFSDVVLGQPGLLSGSGGAIVHMGSTQQGGVRRGQMRITTSAQAMHLLALQTESIGSLRLRGGANTFTNVRGTPAGRELVALEWEMKGGSALLDGTGLDRGAFQALGTLGAPTPATPLDLEEVVAGLSAGQRYQWRTRIATRNPLFPHGLWTTIQGNGKHEKKFGTGFDCNNNGVPDSTEVAQNPSIDCNGNGAPDACDIANGTDPDCDNDGTPNSCELFANDCDGDTLPDDCEIAAGGASVDCNANSVLDTCELSPATDANGDSILDACQFVPYCFGDGMGTPCPCGNSGGAGRGCANSVSANGAVLTVTGAPSITVDTLVLHSTGMPNSAAPSSLYLQGSAQDNGGLGTPIQDGLRCVTGSIIRLGTRPNSGNQSQYPDVGNQIVSIRGGITVPGTTRYYQVFYRNASAVFCPPGTANWTNGLAVTWGT